MVIVDIDGTISKVGDRLKHIAFTDTPNWDKFYEECFKDEPIDKIVSLVELLAEKHEIVFCTGRRESVREQTAQWIVDNLFLFKRSDTLLMRSNGDKRHDTVVKPEMLEKANITKDDVAFILEDRNSMVKKWRELGFTCLQVAEGDF